ncbi:MAG: type II secretion system protein [Thermodesulfovibrionales bacterium]|nr:type II secretion system protein [Thermodesulfovibrionales bacterium]
MRNKGFTLLEVMISIAIVGGLLVTLIYTLNYHLGIAERQTVETFAVNLAKGKIYEMEKKPENSKGNFPEPYDGFLYETNIKDFSFYDLVEINVVVRNGKEEIRLSKLIRKNK